MREVGWMVDPDTWLICAVLTRSYISVSASHVFAHCARLSEIPYAPTSPANDALPYVLM
jgi:hypothetical protein